MATQPGQPALLLEPIARPVGPDGVPLQGTRGRALQLKLRTNTYKVRLDPRPNIVWYKYSVNILSTRPPRVANAPPTLPPKSLLRRIWAAMEAAELSAPYEDKQLGGVLPVYDGRSACFTASPLPTPPNGGTLRIIVTLPGDRVGQSDFSVDFINPIRLHVDELKNWYSNTNAFTNQSDANDCIQALNALFHHGLALLYPSNKTTFFVSDPAQHGLLQVAKHMPVKLPRGIELWRGFFEAVRPCFRGLYLNLDTTSGAFIQSGNLIDWLLRFIGGRNRTIQSLFATQIRPLDIIRVNRLLKGVMILINFGNAKAPLKNVKVNIGLSKESAASATFRVGDDGAATTVEEYFRTHFQIQLQFPQLPCIATKKGRLYPIELCTIQPGTKSIRRLDSEQQELATAFQTLAPSERLRTITELRSQSLSNAHGPYLPQFNVTLDDNVSKLIGRILAPPRINYGQSPESLVERGEWKMARNKQKFFDGSGFKTFALLVKDVQMARAAEDFMKGFFASANQLGLRAPRDFPRGTAYIAGSQAPSQAIGAALHHARTAFCTPQIDVIFWAFDLKKDERYDQFKTEGMFLGIPTQAIQSKNLRKAESFQFVINLAMKLNAKLRGQNFSFVAGSLCGDGLRTQSWLEAHDAMVMAADLTHTEDKPSVAVVVGSLDRNCLVYEDEISAQPLIEPPTPQRGELPARAKKSEVILNIRQMVLALLKRYSATNQRPPPTSILFYRDGVSESEFSVILSYEVSEIKRAFQDFRAQFARASVWKPKLTFICTIKRHHIRFFGDAPVDSRSVEGPNGNIPAGTVVDSAVVADARAFDWHAAAHTGTLGTTKPTRYVVMEDGHGMMPDDLQSVTNALCHGYQRCNRAVSIPAPVYYADLICTRVRAWLPQDEGSIFSGGSSATAQTRANDLDDAQRIIDRMRTGRAMLQGSTTEKPSMWFL